MDEGQLDIFSSFYEAGPKNWGAPRKEPSADLNQAQIPMVTPAGLVPLGEKPGVLARPITPHSLIKQDRVFRYANTVATAMTKKWSVWWLDLFSGPGMVFDRTSSEFRDAIPLQVINGTRRPFAGYVFSDLSKDCAGSLEQLVGPRKDVTIGCGDANDRDHLQNLVARIPRDALVIAYLDPEALHLHFETIRLLAWHFKRLDLLLNVPVLAIDRAMSADAFEPVRRVLNHPDPAQLQAGAMTSSRIRDWFKRKLSELGYPPELIIGNEIRSEKNKTPQYDLMLASRVKLASELYRKANEVDSDGQRGFSIAV